MRRAPFDRQVLIVLGKGGVGRTTVSAALAIRRANAGGRALVLEYDANGGVASIFGRTPSLDAAEVAPGVFALILDGVHQLGEYLGTVIPSRVIRKTVIGSRIFRYFVEAAPGLRELIMVGKPVHELERRPSSAPQWDLIVMDAPASGHALELLKMPFVADQTFGASVVGREARNVARLLSDRERCGVVIVTSPEPFAVRETLETHAALAEAGLEVAALVFNRVHAPGFTARDANEMARTPALRALAPHLDRVADLAHADLARAAAERRAIALVARRTGAAIITVPDLPARPGAEIVRSIADYLGAAPAPIHRSGGAPAARGGRPA